MRAACLSILYSLSLALPMTLPWMTLGNWGGGGGGAILVGGWLCWVAVMVMVSDSRLSSSNSGSCIILIESWTLFGVGSHCAHRERRVEAVESISMVSY